MRVALCLCGLLFFLAGCHVPAQMVWSPDGKMAGFRVGKQLILIDENGKALSPAERCSGGMCWSKDSGAFYFATEDEKGEVSRVMLKRGAESKSLFEIPNQTVFHMSISPDEKWLAVIVGEKEKAGQCSLIVQHLETGKVITLSSRCALAMCFTGDSRIAFIEPDSTTGPAVNQPGAVVEVLLDEKVESPERKRLMNVMTDEAMWLQPMGENLLLSAPAAEFPVRVRKKIKGVNKLYHFARADGSVCAIADDVGPIFSVSPDGSQILIEKLLVANNEVARREMALIKPNGSDGRILRDLTGFPSLPMWPAWRGTSELAFVPPMDINKPLRVEADDTVRFDVVLYKLNEMYELQPERVLSEGWAGDLKPFYKVVAPVTSRPATQSVQ